MEIGLQQTIESKILLIRDRRVMLDKDLALLYSVETKALNRAVKRNLERFPGDFMFQLTGVEFENLRFHFGTSSWGGATLHTICLYRKWRGHAFKRVEQQKSHTGQYSDHEDIYEASRDTVDS